MHVPKIFFRTPQPHHVYKLREEDIVSDVMDDFAEMIPDAMCIYSGCFLWCHDHDGVHRRAGQGPLGLADTESSDRASRPDVDVPGMSGEHEDRKRTFQDGN